MLIIDHTISFILNKKRALILLAASFFVFLQSSIGPNNFLRADSEIYHVDFYGVVLMTIFIIVFSAYISYKNLINFGYLLLLLLHPDSLHTLNFSATVFLFFVPKIDTYLRRNADS